MFVEQTGGGLGVIVGDGVAALGPADVGCCVVCAGYLSIDSCPPVLVVMGAFPGASSIHQVSFPMRGGNVRNMGQAYGCSGPRRLFKAPEPAPVIAAMMSSSRNWRFSTPFSPSIGTGLPKAGAPRRRPINRPLRILVTDDFMMLICEVEIEISYEWGFSCLGEGSFVVVVDMNAN